MQPWPVGEIRSLPLESIDERYRRYRLADRSAERAIRGSLERYGQLSPVVVSVQEGQLVLVDGFKRLQAARTLKNTETLSARRLEVDEQGAKAAIYTLNRIARPEGVNNCGPPRSSNWRSKTGLRCCNRNRSRTMHGSRD